MHLVMTIRIHVQAIVLKLCILWSTYGYTSAHMDRARFTEIALCCIWQSVRSYWNQSADILKVNHQLLINWSCILVNKPRTCATNFSCSSCANEKTMHIFSLAGPLTDESKSLTRAYFLSGRDSYHHHYSIYTWNRRVRSSFYGRLLHVHAIYHCLIGTLGLFLFYTSVKRPAPCLQYTLR